MGTARSWGAELKGVEEHGAEPVQHWPRPRGKRRQIYLVRAGQALGFGDARRQPLPADRVRDGAVQVSIALLGRDQGAAEPDQQAHLVVDGPSVAQEGALLARLGAAEHSSDCAVEQADAVVGQAGRGVQYGRDQGRSAAEQRQRPQVLGGVAAALAGQLAQPLRMHAIGAGGIEADQTQVGQLVHDAGEGLVAGRTWRLPRPAQDTQQRSLLGHEQRIQRLGLGEGQVAGELARDVALGHDQGSGDQLLDDKGTWCNEAASAQLFHECLGNAGRTRGRECHRQQPSQDVAAQRGCQVGKAERSAKGAELLVTSLEPGGIGRQGVRVGAKLLSYKAERGGWDQFAWPQQAAGVAQRTKLQGKAKPVAVAPVLVDSRKVGVAQRPVPDQVGFGNWQGEEVRELRFGERASSRHGGLSRLE